MALKQVRDLAAQTPTGPFVKRLRFLESKIHYARVKYDRYRVFLTPVGLRARDLETYVRLVFADIRAEQDGEGIVLYPYATDTGFFVLAKPVIRPVAPEDNGWIRELYGDDVPDDLQNAHASYQGRMYVVSDGSGMVARAGSQIKYLIVRPKDRSRRIGSELMHRVSIDLANEEMTMVCRSDNVSANLFCGRFMRLERKEPRISVRDGKSYVLHHYRVPPQRDLLGL